MYDSSVSVTWKFKTIDNIIDLPRTGLFPFQPKAVEKIVKDVQTEDKKFTENSRKIRCE